MSVPPPQAPEQVTPELAAPRDHPRRLWVAPAAIVLGLGLGQVGVIVVSVIGQAVGGSTFTHPSPAVSLINNVVADLAFVAAALYFTRLGGGGARAAFGFHRTPPGRAAGVVAAAAAAYYLLTFAYAALLSLHRKDKLPSELGVHHSTAALIGAAAFVCVIAPVAEELFFRGFLFGVLSRWRVSVLGCPLGPWVAALIVGILFGAAHFSSAPPEYLVPLGFLGFLLCLVRWRTKSLLPCMVLHSMNNSVALGVNELHWSAGEILTLIVGALAVIGLMTAPLVSRAPAPSVARR